MELWIARDEDGQLWLFDQRPILRHKNEKDYFKYSWFDLSENGLWNCRLNDGAFLEVTFENSPQRVELELPDLHIIY